MSQVGKIYFFDEKSLGNMSKNYELFFFFVYNSLQQSQQHSSKAQQQQMHAKLNKKKT